MAQSWTNGDGLFVRFGNLEGTLTEVGEYGNYDPGSIHMVQLNINGGAGENLNTLTKQVHHAVRFPGANDQTFFLYKAEVEVEVAFDSAGEAATLTIGFDNLDGTVFDADGVDVAIAEAAIDAVGDTVVCDGAQVGVRLNNTQPLNLTTTVGTEVFTAGKGWIRLWYYLVNI